MSPRIIQMPLSGGDRKYYARELKRAEREHESFVKRAAEAHVVADEYRRMAHRLDCQEWSVRQFIGGDVEPSPTIAAAIDAGYILLRVECRACGHGDRINLAEVIWPREKPVHTLTKALVCKRCQREGEPKRRPNLMGLERLPEPDPPRHAMRRR